MSLLSSKMDDDEWGRFKHENLQFSLVNTIASQILVALDPNLYHGCISGVSWLSSKMDELDLFFEVIGVDFNMKICMCLSFEIDNLDLSCKIMTSILAW